MPEIRVDEETLERLEGLKRNGETHDELVNELINIYEAGELTLSHGGDHVGPK